MEPITIFIAIVASLMVLCCKPIYALGVYLVVLFGYSQNLTIPVGTIDFTTGRIVVMALIINIIFRAKLHRFFHVSWLDFWVFIGFVTSMIALHKNTMWPKILERQSGAFIDTFLPYLAVRLVIRSREDLLAFLKMLIMIGIPLALMGAFQSLTGRNPVGFMQEHYGFGLVTDDLYATRTRRYGLWRADVTIGNAIIFGLFFASVLPMAIGLWYQRVWSRRRMIIFALILLTGLISSVSSAPIFAIIIFFGFTACYRFRRYWPGLLFLFVVVVLFVEVYSNRHFYHVLTRFAFSAETAYYRIGLIEEALGGGMKGHWLFGYGYVGVGPGTDNTFFNWIHMDLVNIYVRKLAQTGLMGLMPFLIVNFMYYHFLLRAFRRARTLADRWLIWCFTGGMIGWNLAMLTVSAMNQVEILLYMYIALSFNLPAIMCQKANAMAPVRNKIPHKATAHRRDASAPIIPYPEDSHG